MKLANIPVLEGCKSHVCALVSLEHYDVLKSANNHKVLALKLRKDVFNRIEHLDLTNSDRLVFDWFETDWQPPLKHASQVNNRVFLYLSLRPE